MSSNLTPTKEVFIFFVLFSFLFENLAVVTCSEIVQ